MSDIAITLHGTPLSGHAHRVELLLRALGLPFAYRDATAAVRKSAAFRALNPFGQVPVLEHGELVLADSAAIMVFLAKRYAPDTWLPEAAEAAAAVQRWLAVAAGEVMYGPALARMVTLWGMAGDAVRSREIAGRLLPVMDAHLAGRDWLAADRITIADLACYSYTAHAPEGRIPLDGYPNLTAWHGRVEAMPFFKPMPRSPIPAGAP